MRHSTIVANITIWGFMTLAMLLLLADYPLGSLASTAIAAVTVLVNIQNTLMSVLVASDRCKYSHPSRKIQIDDHGYEPTEPTFFPTNQPIGARDGQR